MVNFAILDAMRLRSFVRRWFRQARGQDLIEYALLASFVSLAVYTAAGGLGTSVNGWYDALAENIAGKSGCSSNGAAHSGGVCSGESANNAGGNGNGRGGGSGQGNGK